MPAFPRGKLFSEGLIKAAPNALLILFFFLPSVSTSVVAYWNCRGFEVMPNEKEYYLRNDLSVRCGSAQHKSLTAMACTLLRLDFCVLSLTILDV